MDVKTASNVSKVRKFFRLNRSELGKLLNKHHLTIYRWEKEGVYLSKKTASLLDNIGISAEYIYSGEGDMIKDGYSVIDVFTNINNKLEEHYG